jgi:hypothetical protein
VFDTVAETYYVKKGFNNSATTMSRLGITHLILQRGHTSGRFARFFRQEYRTKERRLSVRLAGTSYTLYRLQEPLSDLQSVQDLGVDDAASDYDPLFVGFTIDDRATTVSP